MIPVERRGTEGVLSVLAIAFHAGASAAIDAIAGPNAGMISHMEAANAWVKVEGTIDALAFASWLVVAGFLIRSYLRGRQPR